MNKQKLFLSITFAALLGTISTVLITNEKINNSNLFAITNDEEVWHHYSAVAPTENTYGSKEFWAKGSEGCKTRYFVNPGVSCVEHDFSEYDEFATLTYGHELYVPSLFNQRNAVYPINNGDDTFDYGIYPQTKVTDSSLVTTLNGLNDSYIQGNSWYLYEGVYYAKKDSDNWFICEAIRWTILANYGSGRYLLCTYKGLDVHRFDDNSSDYGSSELRTFINNDVYTKAFYLNDEHIEGSSDYLNDNMYALSRSDYDERLAYVLRPCDPTDWLRANGAAVGDGHVCYWTSTAINGTDVYFGALNGGLGNTRVATDETFCIRPGITIDIA